MRRPAGVGHRGGFPLAEVGEGLGEDVLDLGLQTGSGEGITVGSIEVDLGSEFEDIVEANGGMGGVEFSEDGPDHDLCLGVGREGVEGSRSHVGDR